MIFLNLYHSLDIFGESYTSCLLFLQCPTSFQVQKFTHCGPQFQESLELFAKLGFLILIAYTELLLIDQHFSANVMDTLSGGAHKISVLQGSRKTSSNVTQ